ncbi:MAG: aminopeptidase P family protein [Desulfobacterium sp.]|nr:aminopeptidase P family protein [Desulfobacterium sp.]
MKQSIIKERIQRIRKRFTDLFDTLVILSDENRYYLSGYTGEDGSYDETAGILIITQNDLILATDSRYDTQAKNETDLYTVHCCKNSLAKELPGLLKSVGAKRVGIEGARLTYQQYQKICDALSTSELSIEFTPADDTLRPLRINKDQGELSKIKAVLAIAERAFLEFRTKIHVGMTEKEAAWLLEQTMRQMGADALSFPVIAASGPNSALAHAIPGERQFKAGEPLLFDFGAKLDGYCSDTTRTLVIGEPDNRFTEIYDILFHAQQLAVDAVRTGVEASAIDKIARDYIDATIYNGRFGHSLGHGVGLAIHEEPRFSRFDHTLLEPGMIVTVEPGIYIPEWGGIRLENMIQVTDQGAEVLNTMDYREFRL